MPSLPSMGKTYWQTQIVKYWLPHIKVLEPEWLDEMIREYLEIYLSD